jgi:hypothetical protein
MFARLKSSFDGSMACVTFRPELASKHGSNGSPLGNPGDVEPVGAGVSELRINYGPGYRVYFKKRGRELIILLAGGDKSTQAKDIKAALRFARDLSE